MPKRAKRTRSQIKTIAVKIPRDLYNCVIVRCEEQDRNITGYLTALVRRDVAELLAKQIRDEASVEVER